MATRLFSDRPFELACAKTFEELACLVNDGSVDVGLMAIENSTAGSILENFDIISHHKLKIIGEGYLRIRLCLVGSKDQALEDIKIVYSHVMALKQCKKFMNESSIEAREYYDTAASVDHVVKLGKKEVGAVAPSLAAKIYGGKVLKAGIETNRENYTRFILVTKVDSMKQSIEVASRSDNKLSKVMLEFVLKHQVGSLAEALSLFARNGFNLTKIESRPILGKSWEYRFYVDFVTENYSAVVLQKLNSLRDKFVFFDVKGIFPVGETYSA